MKLITIEKDIYRITDKLFNNIIKTVEDNDEKARDNLLYFVVEKYSVYKKLDGMFNY